MTDLEIVLDAARKWANELVEYIAPDAEQRGADQEVDDYADQANEIIAAVERMEKDTSINVYFTGDEDGPDLFGVVYDDEDGVLESAHENEVHGWRVPVQPLLERAVRLDGDHDD